MGLHPQVFCHSLKYKNMVIVVEEELTSCTF